MKKKKIKGKPIASKYGVDVYFTLKEAKKKGKDRLWIVIDQKKSKKWRIASSLSFVHGLKIRFEKERKNERY